MATKILCAFIMMAVVAGETEAPTSSPTKSPTKAHPLPPPTSAPTEITVVPRASFCGRCYVDPTVEDIGIYNVFFAESGWVFYSMVRDFLPVKSRNLIENYVVKMLEKNDFDFQQYFQIVKNF